MSAWHACCAWHALRVCVCLVVMRAGGRRETRAGWCLRGTVQVWCSGKWHLGCSCCCRWPSRPFIFCCVQVGGPGWVWCHAGGGGGRHSRAGRRCLRAGRPAPAAVPAAGAVLPFGPAALPAGHRPSCLPLHPVPFHSVPLLMPCPAPAPLPRCSTPQPSGTTCSWPASLPPPWPLPTPMAQG